MANVLISENWPDLLAPGFRKIFTDTYQQLPSQLDKIFNIQDSEQASEKLSQAGAFPGVSEFTGKIEYSESPAQGYDKTVTHTEYAGGYIVERKLAADDLNNIGVVIGLNAKTNLRAFFTDKVITRRILQCVNSQERLLMRG